MNFFWGERALLTKVSHRICRYIETIPDRYFTYNFRSFRYIKIPLKLNYKRSAIHYPKKTYFSATKRNVSTLTWNTVCIVTVFNNADGAVQTDVPHTFRYLMPYLAISKKIFFKYKVLKLKKEHSVYATPSCLIRSRPEFMKQAQISSSVNTTVFSEFSYLHYIYTFHRFTSERLSQNIIRNALKIATTSVKNTQNITNPIRLWKSKIIRDMGSIWILSGPKATIIFQDLTRNASLLPNNPRSILSNNLRCHTKRNG